MSFESDLKAAAEAFIAADRIRLGGPLTPEEIDAYHRGELSGDAAARVRALLIYGPDDRVDDDVAVLTPAEVAHDRAKLLARIAADSGAADTGVAPERQRRFSVAWRSPAALRAAPLRFAPLAAAILFAALLVQSHLALRRTTSNALAPSIAGPRFVLEPAISARGPAAAPAFVLPANEDSVTLMPRLDDDLRAHYRDHRLAIVDGNGRTVWQSATIRPTAAPPLGLTLRRGFLDAGTYRLDIQALDDGEWQTIATYAIRVERR